VVTQVHLLLKLRMREAIPPLPFMFTKHGAMLSSLCFHHVRMADTNQKSSELCVSPMSVPYCIDLLPISAAAAKGAVNISPFRSVESCDCSVQPPQGSKFCNNCWPHVSKLSREEGKSCSLMHCPVICHWCTTSAFVNHVHDLPR
jgi:hypothetical protein